VDVETIRWGGVTALQVTSNVSASLPPNGKGVPEFAQNMQQLFGPDGKLVAWIVPANEHRIVIGYEDKEHLRQIVEAIQQGSEGLGANSEATGLPSGNAAMVGCLSPSGTVDFIQRMLAVLLPPNVRAAMTVPPFPQTPPIRFTMNISRDALENNLVVPAEFLRAIVPYSEELQAAGAKAAERPVPPDTQGEKKAPEAAATPSS
jgi:hypothetical protein